MGSTRFPGKVLADLKGEPMLLFLLKRYCYRGSEDDVLSRFIEIGKDFDTVIRVTGDCPLVNSQLVSYVLRLHRGGYSAHLGIDGLEVEVIDSVQLGNADKCSSESQREHVTPAIRALCKMVPLVKLSVDYPEDLERIREFLG